MPFKSEKQLKYLEATHPEIAKRWIEEAKKQHEPVVKKQDGKWEQRQG